MPETLDQIAIAQIARRIRERLRRLKLTPRAASMATHRGPDLIRNLLRAADAGKPYNPREDTLDRIAKVLEVSAIWLRYGDGAANDDASSHKPPERGLIYASDTPDYMGLLETEVYRLAFAHDEDLGFHPPIGVDPRYPRSKQGIWLARGDGGSKIGISSGMYVTGVLYNDYTEIVGPLAHGMIVIIERTADEGLYVESSLREYQIWPDRIEFVAQSLKGHESITLPLGWSPSEHPSIEIIAVVTGGHIPFENEGFLPHYY